jgi:hypothetical protein
LFLSVTFALVLYLLARLEPTNVELLIGLYFKDRLLARLVNIRLQRKRVKVTKILTNDYITELKAGEFILYCHFHPSLIFAGKAGAYQSGATYRALL